MKCGACTPAAHPEAPCPAEFRLATQHAKRPEAAEHVGAVRFTLVVACVGPLPRGGAGRGGSQEVQQFGGPRILDRYFDLAGTLKQTGTGPTLSAAQCAFFFGGRVGRRRFKRMKSAFALGADCVAAMAASWPESGKNRSLADVKVASAAMSGKIFARVAR